MTSIGRPHRQPIGGRVERELGESLPSEVPNPDVVVLVADVEGYARAIRRHSWVCVGAGRRLDRFLMPLTVDPNQGPRPGHDGAGQIDQRAVARDSEVGSAKGRHQYLR